MNPFLPLWELLWFCQVLFFFAVQPLAANSAEFNGALQARNDCDLPFYELTFFA